VTSSPSASAAAKNAARNRLFILPAPFRDIVLRLF
jgi:hypothetical protein